MFKGRRLLTATLIALSMVLAGFGIAIAQGNGGESSGNGETAIARTANGETAIARTAILDGQAQLEEARNIQTRGTQLSRRLLQMLDEARGERDIIRVTCLNDKLTQVNTHLGTLEVRINSLDQAVNGNENERRNHEYTVITVLSQHFTTLDQEASQCVGEGIYDTGTTRITTTIDPGTPTNDPAILPPNASADIAMPPPPASRRM